MRDKQFLLDIAVLAIFALIGLLLTWVVVLR